MERPSGIQAIAPRAAEFTGTTDDRGVRTEFRCPCCEELPRVFVTAVGQLPVAECICPSCAAVWLLELDLPQMTRLLTRPPEGLHVVRMLP